MSLQLLYLSVALFHCFCVSHSMHVRLPHWIYRQHLSYCICRYIFFSKCLCPSVDLCVSLLLYLFTSLSRYLPTSLSTVCIPISLSLCLSVFFPPYSSVSLPPYLSVSHGSLRMYGVCSSVHASRRTLCTAVTTNKCRWRMHTVVHVAVWMRTTLEDICV